MRAGLVALLAMALSAAAAQAEVDILAVESATGGIWRPGRFSPVRVKARAPAGEHEIRARLEPGKVVVETLRSAGGEGTVLLPLLPEADADAVEIDVGAGWTRHEVRLRRHDGERPVVGVVRGVSSGDLEQAHRWTRVDLPRGDARGLEDICDVTLASHEWEATLEMDSLLQRWKGEEPTLAGPRVVRWLDEHAAGAQVGPDGVRNSLPGLVISVVLVLALAFYGGARRWRTAVVVAAAAALQAGLLLAGVTGTGRDEDVPRATARGFSIIRPDGGRVDLLVLSSRGEATVRFDAGEGALLRPLSGETGETGAYVLRDGRILEDVALGRGRRRFLRIDRGWSRVVPSRPPVGIDLEAAYEIDGDGAVDASGHRLTLAELWDRFRDGGPESPLGPRGVLLRKIARPALRPGTYGLLRVPPILDARAMGVERAEVLHALLVP